MDQFSGAGVHIYHISNYVLSVLDVQVVVDLISNISEIIKQGLAPMAFAKGNQFGRGRPKISLQKPELLLPAVFGKAGVNWQNDFIKLYRAVKEDRALSIPEIRLLKFFSDYMPYLCTKVQLKEIEGKMTTPSDSVANAKATSKLLQALEAEQGMNAPKFEGPSNP